MKILRTNKISDSERIGIIMAEEWFDIIVGKNNYIHSIYRNFYVVGKWYEYSNGHDTKIEGKHTIAICEKLQDAETVFNNYKIKEQTLEVSTIDPIIDYKDEIEILSRRGRY